MKRCRCSVSAVILRPLLSLKSWLVAKSKALGRQKIVGTVHQRKLLLKKRYPIDLTGSVRTTPRSHALQG
jgi:hypothetical protein